MNERRKGYEEALASVFLYIIFDLIITYYRVFGNNNSRVGLSVGVFTFVIVSFICIRLKYPNKENNNGKIN